jgi:tRNA(His) guanylyltransferase
MSKDKLSIAKRMKKYESVSSYHLSNKVPVIIRIDGRGFHNVTKKLFGRNWSEDFTNIMIETAKFVQSDIQGCSFCYCQSDEISFLLTDYKTITTDAWFDYNLSKIISISASLASSIFSKLSNSLVCFDSRAFSLCENEVTNYFVCRQIDAARNAIQMAAREYFSHKELYKKNCNEIQEMLFQKGINFDKLPVMRKRGFCIINKQLDDNIPIFSKNREYIEKFIDVKQD